MKRLNHYNYSPEDYSMDIINKLIYNKRCRINAIYKENNILCSDEELNKKFYKMKDCLERLPKISMYYKNYLKYFCRPKIVDIKKNSVLEYNGEVKAEIYYKKNYNTNTTSNTKEYEFIFSDSIKEKIEDKQKSISEIIIEEKNSQIMSKSMAEIIKDLDYEKVIHPTDLENLEINKNSNPLSPKILNNYKLHTQLGNILDKNKIIFPNINIYNTHISKSNKNLKIKIHNNTRIKITNGDHTSELRSLSNNKIINKFEENIRHKKLIDTTNKPVEINNIIINKSLSRNVLKFLQDKTEDMKIFKTYNNVEGN